MCKLSFNKTLEKTINEYCKVNGIEDINAFANRCALHGLNIVKFGTSPADNIERENNGIKDLPKNGKRKKKEDIVPTNEGEQNEVAEQGNDNNTKEEGSLQEKKGESVKVRKIKVIKKE